MKRKYILWTFGLSLLVFFVGPHGGAVPLNLLQIEGVIATLTGNQNTIELGIYSILHIASILTFVFVGRQKNLSKKKILIILTSLIVQALSPIIMTLYLSNEQKYFTYATAVPLWLASIVTGYYLTTLYKDKNLLPTKF